MAECTNLPVVGTILVVDDAEVVEEAMLASMVAGASILPDVVAMVTVDARRIVVQRTG